MGLPFDLKPCKATYYSYFTVNHIQIHIPVFIKPWLYIVAEFFSFCADLKYLVFRQ